MNVIDIGRFVLWDSGIAVSVSMCALHASWEFQVTTSIAQCIAAAHALSSTLVSLVVLRMQEKLSSQSHLKVD